MADRWDRVEKIVVKAIVPIINFYKYKVTECAAVWKFTSLLRSSITSDKAVGLIKMLVNEQRLTGILEKMPADDRKHYWAKEKPMWMQEEASLAFERSVD
jgi:hypothetical protein